MRKFMAGVVVGAVLGGAYTTVGAQKGYGGYGRYGVGTQTCGTWVKDISKSPDLYIFNAWIAGFVSGAGWMGDILKKTDAPAMELFVTNYCNEHPLNNVADASEALVRALR